MKFDRYKSYKVGPDLKEMVSKDFPQHSLLTEYTIKSKAYWEIVLLQNELWKEESHLWRPNYLRYHEHNTIILPDDKGKLLFEPGFFSNPITGRCEDGLFELIVPKIEILSLRNATKKYSMSLANFRCIDQMGFLGNMISMYDGVSLNNLVTIYKDVRLSKRIY